MAEKLITGFQYSPVDGAFIGEYQFPNNLDKEEIHMPPNTTLLAPPAEVPFGSVAKWDGKAWVVIAVDQVSSVVHVKALPTDGLEDMLPGFVDFQIEQGFWPASVRAEWEAAVAAKEERLAAEEAARAAKVRVLPETTGA